MAALLTALPHREESAWQRRGRDLAVRMDRLIGRRFVAVVVALVFLLPSLPLIGAVAEWAGGELASDPERNASLAMVAVSLAAAVLVMRAGFLLRADRDRALRLLRWSLLADLLLGQAFKFTVGQFGATVGLALELLLFAVLSLEIRRRAARAAAPVDAPGEQPAAALRRPASPVQADRSAAR